MDPKLLELLPEIRKEITERAKECLRENRTDVKNRAEVRALQAGKDASLIGKFLIELDREINPSQKEEENIFKATKELGLEDWQVVNDPVICGTKEIEYERTKEVMNFLHNSKMSPDLWDVTRVDNIMFVDTEFLEKNGVSKIDREKTGGATLLPKEIRDNKGLSRTVHVMVDEKGKLIAESKIFKDIPEGKALTWTLAHEIFHLNHNVEERIEHKDEKTKNINIEFIVKGPAGTIREECKEEWNKAMWAQIQKGAVSEYSLRGIQEENIDKKISDEEFACEHFAAWAIDHPGLCPEMEEFFDKYFSKNS